MTVHCKIDDFFKILMQKLQIDIPEFKLERWVELKIEESKSGKETLKVHGVTEFGGVYDLFKSVTINGTRTNSVALTQD